jgi:hypothetical protein
MYQALGINYKKRGIHVTACLTGGEMKHRRNILEELTSKQYLFATRQLFLSV